MEQKLKVDPAWVVCAPPDYAPMQKSVRTMWDLMRSVAVKSGMLTRPQRPSFTKDILPIFQRMTDLQWVNAGFAGAFGWGGQFNYTSKQWIKKLGNPSPAFFRNEKNLFLIILEELMLLVLKLLNYGLGYMEMHLVFLQQDLCANMLLYQNYN